MGQYYRIINVDKREVLYSFDFGNGQKLMEWSWNGNPMVRAMLNLMEDEWKGDRVYVCGDYAEDDSCEPWSDAYRDTLSEIPDGIYSASSTFLHRIPDDKELIEFRDNFDNTKEVSVEDFEWRYIYNHDLHCYIDLKHCPLEWAWFGKDENGNDNECASSIFPLSLLLAMGNGRGGGDYRGDNDDLCGSWCDSVQSIEITQEKLDCDYEEYCPDFTEHELVPYADYDKFMEAERAKYKAWHDRTH